MSNTNRIPNWASGLVFILIVSLLVYFFTSWREERNEEKYKYIEKEYKEKQRIVDSIAKARALESDSLKLIISKLTKSNEKMKESRKKKAQEIEDIKKEPLPEFKDNRELLDFFSKRYENGVFASDNNTVSFKTPTAKELAKDLTLLGQYERQIPLYEEMIASGELQNSQLERIIGIQSTVITSCNNEIKEREYLQKVSDDSIKELESTVKREKRKNFLLKIIVPISAALGGLVAYKAVSED